MVPCRFLMVSSPGNFPQLFNRHSYGFHREIVKKYGGVVKLSGLLGVRSPSVHSAVSHVHCGSWYQTEELYVTDPRALHHIVVKDQYVYEETASFITWAFICRTSHLSIYISAIILQSKWSCFRDESTEYPWYVLVFRVSCWWFNVADRLWQANITGDSARCSTPSFRSSICVLWLIFSIRLHIRYIFRSSEPLLFMIAPLRLSYHQHVVLINMSFHITSAPRCPHL